MRSRIIVILFALISVAGCKESNPEPSPPRPRQPTPSRTEIRLFDSTELKDLVLQETSAPQGMGFTAEGSGPRSAQETFGEKAEKLQEFGFIQSFYSNFIPSKDVQQGSSTGAFYLWTVAVAFPTESSAVEASNYIRDNPSPTLQNYQLVQVDSLGSSGWSFQADRQTESDSVPEVGFCFVVSNVVMLVQAEGNKPPGVAGGLAREEIQSIAVTLKNSAEEKLTAG